MEARPGNQKVSAMRGCFWRRGGFVRFVSKVSVETRIKGPPAEDSETLWPPSVEFLAKATSTETESNQLNLLAEEEWERSIKRANTSSTASWR